MKPLDHYTNGDEGADSEDSADSEAEELSLEDGGAPARALAALNALRKSRQHYDVVLVAGGAEVAAHRAVLAAASPYLLAALGGGAAPLRVADVAGAALRSLVEYAYTGRLSVRSAAAARELYLAAWRLRVEAARAHLAERLTRRPRARDCLQARALPGLAPHQLAALDAFIADNFEEICACGALGSLPCARVEVVRGGAAPAPRAAAEAVLAWLLAQPAQDPAELCSRTHLVFVDARGALRDCGELPSAPGDAPELRLYRDAAARRPSAPPAPPAPAAPVAEAPSGVLAARRAAGGGARALLLLRGALLAVRARWAPDAAGAGGAGEEEQAARPAQLAGGRCALGAAALGARLLACGGYDRARVLRSVESYSPALDAWRPAPDMRRERARFPVAVLGDTMYAFGGSDGHAELDSVEAYSAAGGWAARARLPQALSHAAAACDALGGALYVAGGWAGGAHLRRAWRYSPAADAWSEAPPLGAARSQAAAAVWQGALWLLGGCDAWHCLASAERLALPAGPGAAWQAGPALPTARRSMGACAWRGRLVCAGGSDGAASLRRTDWLEAPAAQWCAGPPLRRARAAAGLAVLADTLYAVGGFDGKEFLACAECLSEPDGEWTALCAPSRPAPPLSAPGGPADSAANGPNSSAANGPNSSAANGPNSSSAKGPDLSAAYGPDSSVSNGPDSSVINGPDSSVINGPDSSAPKGPDSPVINGPDEKTTRKQNSEEIREEAP